MSQGCSESFVRLCWSEFTIPTISREKERKICIRWVNCCWSLHHWGPNPPARPAPTPRNSTSIICHFSRFLLMVVVVVVVSGGGEGEGKMFIRHLSLSLSLSLSLPPCCPSLTAGLFYFSHFLFPLSSFQFCGCKRRCCRCRTYTANVTQRRNYGAVDTNYVTDRWSSFALKVTHNFKYTLSP